MAMNDTQDLDTFVGDSIKREVRARHQVLDARLDVVALRPRQRMFRELLPTSLDGIECSIGRFSVVYGNACPDLDEVLVGHGRFG